MKFDEFFNKNKRLLYKVAVIHGLEEGDVPGTAWLSWHDASQTYRPDAGARFETWASRIFETACRRYAAQQRFGVELDAPDFGESQTPHPAISDDAAIFEVLEPEPEKILEIAPFGGGLTGEICRAAAAGLSVAQIAARVGRTPRRVNQIFAKMRPDPKAPYQQMTLFDLAL